MKKLILAFISLIAFSSCSDKLSKSKAEKLIKECLEKTQEKLTIEIKTGTKFRFVNAADSTSYMKLAKDGFLEISQNPKEISLKYPTYNISITEKAKPFLEETITDDWSSTQIQKMRIGKMEVDKVDLIYEIPNENRAEGKVFFKIIDKTPFWMLTDEKWNVKAEKINFIKTTDGWKFCD